MRPSMRKQMGDGHIVGDLTPEQTAQKAEQQIAIVRRVKAEQDAKLRQLKKETMAKCRIPPTAELKSKLDVITYVIEQKKDGKTKQQVFDDLLDNHKMPGVFARQMVESIRWEQ